MNVQRRERPRARIEIIPMIDTVFFLLVFFMMSSLSMAVYRGMPVNLPTASSGQRALSENASLTVTKEGQFYLNKQPVSLETLLDSLKSLLAHNSDLVIIINADDGVPHGRVVAAMDAARQAGVGRLAIAVKPSEATRR